MLAITGTTGKIGGAVLDALLSYDLISVNNIIVLTSSTLDTPKVVDLIKKGIAVRRANYSDYDAVRSALHGCDAFFLVSTPEIHLDFNDAPPGEGRESRHIKAVDAAIGAGVKRIVYTSVAFKDGSQAGVMRAHFRTEKYLADMVDKGHLESYTILREGLYIESWPLYLGHFKLGGEESREEIVVAGDGKISWTSIADLGLATALVLVAGLGSYHNEIRFLSARKTLSLTEVAALARRTLMVASESEYVSHYRDIHNMDPAFLEWWVSTYPSVQLGLCAVDDHLLEDLLFSKGRTPKSFEDIAAKMLAST